MHRRHLSATDPKSPQPRLLNQIASMRSRRVLERRSHRRAGGMARAPPGEYVVCPHGQLIGIGNPQAIMVSVEPNDGGGHCECDECKAVGTISDRVFLLANQVAEAVAARFPDKYVGLLAYAQHAEPPSFELHPNVYVQLTTSMRRTEMTWEEQIAGFSEKACSHTSYPSIGTTSASART